MKKNAIRSISRKIRQKFHQTESVIGNLQSVYTTALNLKNSLAILKFHLVEKGSINAVRVVEELERLAELAYVSVSDRLDQLSSTANAFNLGQSRTPADDGTDSIYTPKTWSDVHSELLTNISHSIGVCLRSLSSEEMTFDPVTGDVLVQVLAVWEEMLWVVEMNPPKTIIDLRHGPYCEVGFIEDIERMSCALMRCGPYTPLEIVTGVLELSSKTASSIWFIPRADSMGRHVRLNKQVSKRLVEVPVERQPLFQGCMHIIELSDTEQQELFPRLKDYIVRPLQCDSDLIECNTN